MRTLAAGDGDLDLVSGTVTGVESVRQRVQQAMLFHRGEYFIDGSLGIPYLADVLGHQFDAGVAEQAVTGAILEVDGVAAVTEVRVSHDPGARVLAISATVTTDTGETAAVEAGVR